MLAHATFPLENGVYHARPDKALPPYLAPYQEMLKRSHRRYSDAQLIELPNAFAYNVHVKEWEARAKSLQRFLKYLGKQKDQFYILDVGCGNGWFTEKLARSQVHQVIGLDLNLPELEQAANVFSLPNLHFYWGDIFDDIFEPGTFDLVVINHGIELFPDLYELIYTCLQLTKEGGEVHVLDSDILKPHEVAEAQEEVASLYQELGIPEMIPFHHHHTREDLLAFPYKFMHKPGGLKALFRSNALDWPWIRIIKDEFL